MFGKVDGVIHTYFADSPVVIDISGLYWGNPVVSPFTIVRVEVVYNNKVVGDFRADTGGQTSISFDISSALRALWADYDFNSEVVSASSSSSGSTLRGYRSYTLRIYTEYLDSVDGEFTQTQCVDGDGNTDIPGGRCCIGGLTEWERYAIPHKEYADVSHWNHSNLRNGDASTKPTSSPERVGSQSPTSWVDLHETGTRSVFYPANTLTPGADSENPHAPLVLRDSIPYVDFLFVNRRGAVETCSGQTKENMNISVETQQYAHVERPTFQPSRSLLAIAKGGRRSWGMSSGRQTREWTEWWTLEFLMARKWWMKYQGSFVPVIVEPAKKSNGIYDKAKQQMASVEFTVTLALEG